MHSPPTIVFVLYGIIILGMIIGEYALYKDEIDALISKVKSKKVKSEAQRFYSSNAWRRLKAEVFRKYEATCMCCGASRESGEQIQVDHILPRSLHPNLALDISNCQLLCGPCNRLKSNTDTKDWRTEEELTL